MGDFKKMRKLIISVLIRIATFALNRAYDYIDKDKDGKLSKAEINEFYKKVNSTAKKIKNKVY